MMDAYRGRWVRPPLESSLPHEIVDQDGRRRAPMPGFPPFKSRAAATRVLNLWKTLTDDSFNWTVRPVKESE